MQFLDKALKLSRSAGDTNQQCRALIAMGSVELITGDYCTAQVHAREAQRLSKLSANLYDEAGALQMEALCSISLANYGAAIAQFHRAREIIAICGMSGGYMDHIIAVGQAEVHLAKSEYTEAKTIYIQIVETTSPDQNASAYANALLNIALIDTAVGGAAEDVSQHLDKAKEIYGRHNRGMEITLCDMIYAAKELREQRFELAKLKLQECLHSGRGRINEVVSFCLERLANRKAWQIFELQSNWPVVYLAFAQRYNQKLALHKALLFLGDVFISNKDEDTAYSLFTVALEGFTYMDVHQSRADCMLCLGDLASKRGEISQATELWKVARLLFEKSLQAKGVATIDTRLTAIKNLYQAALITW
jgi:tetratricopeptide (TPR) repeat protein